MSSTQEGGLNWKQFGALLLIMIPIILLWGTPVVYPLKILVVFFHELSHGLASVLTGGKMITIELSQHQGGMCTTLGGSRFLILTAGYLGSLLWGGIILVAAARTNYDRAIAVMLGATVLIVGLGYVRPIIGFGFLFCFLMGAAFIASGILLPAKVNDYALKVVGLTSCLYAVLDIVSDGISRDIAGSDANAMGDLLIGPGWFWASLWLVIAVVGSLVFLIIASRGAPPPAPKDLDEIIEDHGAMR